MPNVIWVPLAHLAVSVVVPCLILVISPRPHKSGPAAVSRPQPARHRSLKAENAEVVVLPFHKVIAILLSQPRPKVARGRDNRAPAANFRNSDAEGGARRDPGRKDDRVP